MTVQTPGEQLRAARELAGLSQAEAARLLGRPPTRLCEWETGRRTPRPAALAGAMAQLLAAAARRWSRIMRRPG